MSLSVAIISLAGPRAAAALQAHLRTEADEDVPIRIWTPEEGSVPVRRLAALRACMTEGILLVEDTVRPAGGWRAAVEAALQQEDLVAASGPVRCSPDLGARGRAWALHEYATAIEAGTGARDRLPGHLLLLRVPVVRQVTSDADGLREDAVFSALHGSGWEMRLLHGLAGEIVDVDPRGASLRGQFGHGRGWAARERQRAGWGLSLRAARLAGWPAVACLRTARSLASADGVRVRAWVGALSAAWALGEGVGALVGAGSEDHWS